MATRMQQRRATAAQWTSANPTLAPGEIGFETDTSKFKIGNGVNAWDALDYFQTAADAGGAFIEDSEKGAANGVATLDGTANVPANQLGNVDFTGYATEAYADQAEADAITSSNSYTDTAIANLVDTAPATLDTLNELAAALGDDANFSTTVTNSLASKAPLAQPLNAQSANYTLQSSDNGGVVKASGTITITIPDAVFNAGERVDIVNTGTGVITIAAGSGVTLLSKESAVTIDTQYGAATVLFDSASQAFLIGDLA